jgi:Flp pilus assembly protein TadG
MRRPIASHDQHPQRKAAAAVELAILLPLLALLFSAAVDFARVFHALQAVENAAYSGAMSASGTAWVPGYPTTMTDAAQEAACMEASSLDPALQAANVSVSSSAGTVTVRVVYEFPLMTAVLVPSMSVTLDRSVTLPVAPRPGD